MDSIIAGLSVMPPGFLIMVILLDIIIFAILIRRNFKKDDSVGENEVQTEKHSEEIDPEIVAVITAAISCELGKPPESFEILSIQKSVNWKNAARQDRLK